MTVTWTDRALLFTSTHRDIIAPSPIGLIDCGARGNIPEPWASYEATYGSALRVLGFEADASEAARLSAAHTNRTYIAAAAWNTAGTHDLHITTPAQMSSLFPPNTEQGFLYALSGTQYVNLYKGRAVERTTSVATTTIDAEIKAASFDADVLKCDTQGAEYEILEGATQTLNTSLFAVLAETWTAEIYKGVKPAWAVMRLMAERGYVLMTQEIAGLARRSFPETPTFKFVQREQAISFELLFFRQAKPFVKNAGDAKKAFRAAAIADVYGFPDYAVELLQEIVMRWPGEINNVQKCYDEIVKRRAQPGALDALYPKLHF
jgi:FkbM family methyltransferase